MREGIKKRGDITDNAPLRSGKGSLYEGGTRDAFVVRWPGVTQPGSACNVPTIELYNLADDIGESKNLSKKMPDKAQELHALLVAWRAEVKAPMPTKNDGDAAKQKSKGNRKGKGKKKAA